MKTRAELLAAAAVKAMEKRKDDAYEERNKVVAALSKCFPSGIARTAIEGWSEDWHGCVYIDLPTGQVSWHFHDSQAHLFAHLPPYHGKWDGHDTEEKYRRLAALRMCDPCAWKQAVDDKLVTMESTADSYPTPREAVQAAIDWYVLAALDPKVSSDAEALIERGRGEAARRCLEIIKAHASIEGIAQACEQDILAEFPEAK